MANHKKKKRENYFQQNINKSGRNFMDTMPLDKMKSDCVRVFRELARGFIDINDYGDYFYNQSFLGSCINVAQTKFNFHSISAMGVYCLIVNNIQAENAHAIYDHHNNAAIGYMTIINALTEFRVTGDKYILVNLVLNLAPYRNFI